MNIKGEDDTVHTLSKLGGGPLGFCNTLARDACRNEPPEHLLR